MIANQAVLAAVIIGRNEGQRLVNCLQSVCAEIDRVVYVDSGSTDDSLANAAAFNVPSLSLGTNLPFTAARARNLGAVYLSKLKIPPTYIQFIDGDCELQPFWLAKARIFLDRHPDYAVVCGRRRERFPEQSVFNRWCDLEWQTPLGETKACGGDALIRLSAFQQLSGYRTEMIAGEDPELCFRLRAAGWRIFRLDAEMTLHDAAILRVSQWLQRSRRGGYAYALGHYLHGRSAEKYWQKECLSIAFWGGLLPLLILTGLLFTPWSLLLLLLYPIQILRVALKRRDAGDGKWLWASGIVFGKFPETVGLLAFYLNRLLRKSSRIIEYK